MWEIGEKGEVGGVVVVVTASFVVEKRLAVGDEIIDFICGV